MQKIKLFQINNAYNGLHALRQANEINFKLAWQISDIIEILEKHAVRFQEEMNKITIELGKEVEGQQGMFNIQPNNIKEFNNRVKELEEIEIQLPDFTLLKMNDLNDLKIPGTVNINHIKFFVE